MYVQDKWSDFLNENRKLGEMNMKIFQSVHGKQKFKLTKSISMHTPNLSKCNNLTLIFINLLNLNSTTKLYSLKQNIEQFALIN